MIAAANYATGHAAGSDDSAKVGAGVTALAGIPDFLRRREPDALYSYDSGGRLTIVKGEDAVCLSADDLAGLQRFVYRIAGSD